MQRITPYGSYSPVLRNGSFITGKVAAFSPQIQVDQFRNATLTSLISEANAQSAGPIQPPGAKCIHLMATAVEHQGNSIESARPGLLAAQELKTAGIGPGRIPIGTGLADDNLSARHGIGYRSLARGQ